MSPMELIKAFVVVGPIVVWLSLGLLIALLSDDGRLGDVQGLRKLGGNLSRAVLVLGACLLGLAAIQQLVGLRLDVLG